MVHIIKWCTVIYVHIIQTLLIWVIEWRTTATHGSRHGAKKRKFSGTPLWMLEQKNKMPKAGGGEEEAGEVDEWVLVRLEFQRFFLFEICNFRQFPV